MEGRDLDYNGDTVHNFLLLETRLDFKLNRHQAALLDIIKKHDEEHAEEHADLDGRLAPLFEREALFSRADIKAEVKAEMKADAPLRRVRIFTVAWCKDNLKLIIYVVGAVLVILGVIQDVTPFRLP